jgi:nitrogen regulatory protein PII
MKAVFIVYNQALTEQVEQALVSLSIRGFSKWEDMQGAGSKNGEPHLGTHTWPTMNSGIITVINDELVPKLLEKVEKINTIAEMQGIHAFVWNIETMV